MSIVTQQKKILLLGLTCLLSVALVACVTAPVALEQQKPKKKQVICKLKPYWNRDTLELIKQGKCPR